MQNTLTEVPGLERLREDLAEIEDEVLLGYTLADAMRMGAKNTEQARWTYINAADNQVCALAAAALAVEAMEGRSD